MKIYTLDEVTDMAIGKRGTPEREAFEYKLQMDIIADLIKSMRKKKRLTQEKLGKLVGVQKAQICKLETRADNITLGTFVKVFGALGSDIVFNFKPRRARRKRA